MTRVSRWGSDDERSPGGAQMVGVSRWGSDGGGLQGGSDGVGLQVGLREDGLCMVLR